MDGKRIGGVFAGGCVFWIVAGVVLLGVVLAPFASVAGDYVGVKRADSEARRLQEESQRLTAQVQVDTAQTFNEAAARAIKADTYRAHPELYVVDAIRWIVIMVLGIAPKLVMV